MSNVDWDEYFVSMSYLVAAKSKDKSTHVGAVIIGPDREIRSTGYNGPPRGLDDSDPVIHERPLKYSLFAHAERNAIYNAARIGVSCRECTLVTTYHPCDQCALAIVQSGISEVVIHAEAPQIPGWEPSQKIAADIFTRCKLPVRRWSGEPMFGQVLCGGVVHRLKSK